MNTNRILLFVSVLLFTVFFAPSCRQEVNTPVGTLAKSESRTAITSWNELFLEVERYAAGYRPGPAPRALAYLGLASYEGSLSGMPDYNSLQALYPGLSIPKAESGVEYHYSTIINQCYGYMMPLFFAQVSDELKQKINILQNENDVIAQGQVSAEVFERSKNYGLAVAKAVWDYAVTDAVGHDHYLDPFQGYDWKTRDTSDGFWKPTYPGPGKPMGGVWGNARTFAITQQDKVCRPPYPYSPSDSSEMYAQAFETYIQNTPALSYENEWVGEFWSDDLVNLTFSPGPRWLAIGTQALDNEDSDLETAIVMNAKVGLALNDASVACWYSKYLYNVERPQTYINRRIDASWEPALYNPMTGDQGITPSFPAYPSGHSTMGGAGAEVLASIFGYDYAMTDRCHENRVDFEGTPRSFGSFKEMADENGWSRIPLGVHFQMDCDEGVHFGTVIGRKVNDLPWKK